MQKPVKYLRFTAADRYACFFGDDGMTWKKFVNKVLTGNGFDLAKTRLIKKCPVLQEELYCQQDTWTGAKGIPAGAIV